MRAFVVAGANEASVRDWPTPSRVADETIVTPLLAGVCGTDLELIDATIDPTYVRYPLVLGHEWVGQLLEPAEGIGPPGTRVVVEGVVPCGVCDCCRRGATNLCATYDEIGFTRPGALADLISVPTRLVHAIGTDVSLDDAVLIEPMAVVWRALSRFPLAPRARVAVVGDGTIALLSAHMVRLFDPRVIDVIGRRSEQRDLALRAGATSFHVNPTAESYDLVIEASGAIDGVASALARCDRGGMVILLGLPPHGSHVELAPDDVVNNDLVIQGSFSYTSEAFTEVVRRVNQLDLQPSFLITHRFDLEHASDAVAALRGVQAGEARGKVVIAMPAHHA